jgi:hypothetical protein
MAEPVGSTNQWREPFPEKIAGRVTLLYPAVEDGVWGWTEVKSEAEGIIDVDPADMVAGVDDAATTGGARVFALGGGPEIMVMVES